MLTVITPATSRRLTTIAAVRDQVPLGDDVSDITVGDWIDQASAAIASSCRRPFGRETLRQTFRQPRGETLILARSNLVAVPEVSVDGQAWGADGFECDLSPGLLYRLVGDHRIGWGCGRVDVTFTAGWRLPGDSSRDLPADVEQACLILLAARAAAQGRDPMLRSESTEGVGSASWIATVDMSAMPPQAASLLEPYIRYAVG